VNYKTAGHGAGWAGTEETYLDQWKRMLDWYAEHFEDKDQKKRKALNIKPLMNADFH
jgi:hypothetical protein